MYTSDHEEAMKTRIYTWGWINRRNHCPKHIRGLLGKVAMTLEVSILQVEGVDTGVRKDPWRNTQVIKEIYFERPDELTLQDNAIPCPFIPRNSQQNISLWAKTMNMGTWAREEGQHIRLLAASRKKQETHVPQINIFTSLKYSLLFQYHNRLRQHCSLPKLASTEIRIGKLSYKMSMQQEAPKILEIHYIKQHQIQQTGHSRR